MNSLSQSTELSLPTRYLLARLSSERTIMLQIVNLILECKYQIVYYCSSAQETAKKPRKCDSCYGSMHAKIILLEDYFGGCSDLTIGGLDHVYICTVNIKPKI